MKPFHWLSPMLFASAAHLASNPTDAAAQDAEATYTLRYIAGPPVRIAVSLEVAGDADGSSLFSVLSSWGGVNEVVGLLHELSFSTAAGLPLSVERPDDRSFLVQHAPNARVVARWFLDDSTATPRASSGNDYRPRIRPELCFLIGDVGLLRPDRLASSEEAPRGAANRHKIQLHWEGFAEAGLRFASSHGTDAVTTAELSLDAFLHAAFIAGKLDLIERKVRGGRVIFALDQSDFGLTADALADLGVQIIETERAFFDDWADPLYVVTAVPDGDARGGSMNLGGTGLTNSFALFLSTGADMKPGSDGLSRLKRLLAHEYFHRWNGNATVGEQPEGLSYWFSEGFTDFFARRLLLRGGLSDVARYCADLNESLANYWKNPLRNAPNARIPAGFWTHRNISDLPYRRGDLVALALDHEIRATSSGQQSLDHFMREVLARARERGEPCTTANLLELVADYTCQEFADRLRKVIVDGADVELDPETLAPVLRLTTRRVPGRDGGQAQDLPIFAIEKDVAPELAVGRL